MENPIKMNDWGVPPFQETSKCPFRAGNAQLAIFDKTPAIDGPA